MRLFRSLSIYTVSYFFVAGIPFLLMPVLTEYLSTEDYGVLAMINVSTRVVFPVLSLGVLNALSLEFFRLDKQAYRSYFSSALILPVAAFLGFMILFGFIHRPLGIWMEVPPVWLMIVPVLALLSLGEEVLLVYVRNMDQPLAFGGLRISHSLLEVSLTLLLVVGLGYNWEGRILSWLLVLLLAFAVALIYFHRQGLLSGAINPEYIKGAFLFGIPLIPEQLSTFALSASDRFFIVEFADLSEVGLYSVGSQVGMVILVLVAAFVAGFRPYLFKTLSEITAQKQIRLVQVTYLFLLALLVATLLLSLLTPWIFSVFLNEKFAGGARYVFWIAMGYFFWGVFLLMQGYILYQRKTKTLSVLAIVMIGLNLVLNFFLISRYGTIGAAYATTLSYLIIATVAAILVQRAYPMPWFEFKRLLQFKDIF